MFNDAILLKSVSTTSWMNNPMIDTGGVNHRLHIFQSIMRIVTLIRLSNWVNISLQNFDITYSDRCFNNNSQVMQE